MLATLSESAIAVTEPTGSRWKPLLEGTLKRRAEEAIRDIAAALRGFAGTMSADLAGGAAGLAVLESALSRSGFGGETDAAECWLERAIEAMSTTHVPAALYHGLTGIGWAVEHLRPELQQLDADEINDEIDESLGELLLSSPWEDDYDLVSGLVGYGVYALERLPRPAAVVCLERIVDHFAEMAIRLPDGVTWWTRPELLPDHQRKTAPQGYYNLGLAHGVPGVIALLGRICAAGIAVEQARPLLDDAVRWLLAQQPADGTGFGHWIEPDAKRPSQPARLAWCYGEPGIACALLAAAQCVDEPNWESAALKIARRAAACSYQKSGVKDAGLCHGAAGLGHLFNRLYQATGDAQLGSTARNWFHRTLAMRQPGCGIAGFAAWSTDTSGNVAWLNDPDLLSGAAGIAMALLAACRDIEPNWDRILLASIPPR